MFALPSPASHGVRPATRCTRARRRGHGAPQLRRCPATPRPPTRVSQNNDEAVARSALDAGPRRLSRPGSCSAIRSEPRAGSRCRRRATTQPEVLVRAGCAAERALVVALWSSVGPRWLAGDGRAKRRDGDHRLGPGAGPVAPSQVRAEQVATLTSEGRANRRGGRPTPAARHRSADVDPRADQRSADQGSADQAVSGPGGRAGGRGRRPGRWSGRSARGRAGRRCCGGR